METFVEVFVESVWFCGGGFKVIVMLLAGVFVGYIDGSVVVVMLFVLV